MTNQDKVKDLYDFLQNEGYDFMGTEDDFRGKLGQDGKVDDLYKFLQDEGYDFMGTKDEFKSKVSPAPPTPNVVPSRQQFMPLGMERERPQRPGGILNPRNNDVYRATDSKANEKPASKPAAAAETQVPQNGPYDFAAMGVPTKGRADVVGALSGSDMTDEQLKQGLKQRLKQGGTKKTYDKIQDDVSAAFGGVDAAAGVWGAAGRRTSQAIRERESGRNRLADELSSCYMGGTIAAKRVLLAKVDYMSEHDMQRMSDDAWDALGVVKQTQIISTITQDLKQYYPGADEDELRDYATKLARSHSDQQMYDYAVQQNMPKSVIEFFAKKVIQGNSITKLMEGAAMRMAGTAGDMDARDVAMAEYGKQHKGWDVAASIATVMADPTTYAAGAAGKAAASAVAMVGRNSAARLAASGLGGFGYEMLGFGTRAVPSIVGGAANFAVFEAGGELFNEFQRGDVDWGNVGGQALHGAGVGSIMGIGGQLVGNAFGRLSQKVDSTTGTIALNAGSKTASTVLNGTIFAWGDMQQKKREYDQMVAALSDPNNENYIADPEERAREVERLQAERGEAVWDAWKDSMWTMVGFELAHAPKSAAARIKQYKSMNAHLGFGERVRMMVKNNGGIALTKDEERELANNGYGDIRDLVKESTNNKYVSMSLPNGGFVVGRAGDVPSDRFVELMDDTEISASTRAKLYYFATGNMLPSPTIIRAEMEELKDDSGNVTGWRVDTYGSEGLGKVTSRTYGSKKSADAALADANRQAELNSIQILEGAYRQKESQQAVYDACRDVGKMLGVSGDFIYGRLLNGVTEDELPIVKMVKNAHDVEGERDLIMEKYEIERWAGVSVDEALSKREDSRSDKEKMAVKEYLDVLNDKAAHMVGEKRSEQYMTGYRAAWKAIAENDLKKLEGLRLELDYATDEQARQALAEQWKGVEEALADNLSYAAAIEKAKLRSKCYEDGETVREGVLKAQSIYEQPRKVYVTAGKYEMLEDGSMVDVEKSDQTITIVDEEGKVSMVAPELVEGVKDTPYELLESQITDVYAGELQLLLDNLNGKVAIGDQFTNTNNNMVGKVIAIDGDNATVEWSAKDGSKQTQNVRLAELQAKYDISRRTKYEAAHKDEQAGENNAEPVAKTTEASPAAPAAGVMRGAPERYEDDMLLVIDDGNGGTYETRVISTGDVDARGGYMPKEGGRRVEYMDNNGDVVNERYDRLNEKVVDYRTKEEVEAERRAKEEAKAAAEQQNKTEQNYETAENAKGIIFEYSGKFKGTNRHDTIFVDTDKTDGQGYRKITFGRYVEIDGREDSKKPFGKFEIPADSELIDKVETGKLGNNGSIEDDEAIEEFNEYIKEVGDDGELHTPKTIKVSEIRISPDGKIIALDRNEKSFVLKENPAEYLPKNNTIDEYIKSRKGTLNNNTVSPSTITKHSNINKPDAPRAEQTADEMPMITVKGKKRPDYSKATPEQAHRYNYMDPNVDEAAADVIVQNKINEKQKAFDGIKEKMPKVESYSDMDDYKDDMAAWKAKADAAESEVRYWERVKEIQAERKAEAARAEEEKARIEAERVEEEKRMEEARKEVEAKTEAERAEAERKAAEEAKAKAEAEEAAKAEEEREAEEEGAGEEKADEETQDAGVQNIQGEAIKKKYPRYGKDAKAIDAVYKDLATETRSEIERIFDDAGLDIAESEGNISKMIESAKHAADKTYKDYIGLNDLEKRAYEKIRANKARLGELGFGDEGWEEAERKIAEGEALLEIVSKERANRDAVAKELLERFGFEAEKKDGLSAEQVDKLFYAACRNEETRELYDKVSRLIDHLGIRYDTYLLDPSVDGQSSNDARIRYNVKSFASGDMTPDGVAATILHEKIHQVEQAVTFVMSGKAQRKMAKSKSDKYKADVQKLIDGITEEQKAAWNEINELYKICKNDKEHFKGHFNGRSYAMANVGEFIAEWANPEHREELKKVGLWERFVNGVLRLVGVQKRGYQSAGTAYDRMKDAFERMCGSFTDESWKDFTRISGTDVEKLTESGGTRSAGLAEADGAVVVSSDSWRYSPKTKSEEKKAIEDIVKATGRSEREVKRWIKSEMSLASIFGSELYRDALDYAVDDTQSFLKSNSDYPQGSVDFNNICRKRIPATYIWQKLQHENPNRILTAEDLANMVAVLKEEGIDVPCAPCFVEDRRQKLGEIAYAFIKAAKDNFVSYGNQNQTKGKVADKCRSILKDYSPEQLKEILSIDNLITLDGNNQIKSEYPEVYDAFVAFNNARGQQAGRLFVNYAEYKREILNWDDNRVKRVNDDGGLRIFSTSDFEAHHLLDIIQIVQDCAVRGVKIQGYTKVPAFAKAVENTGIKLNLSLIPKGDGYHMEDGKAVLDFDPVEGIDANDPDYKSISPDNKNIGNIIIGINDEHIRACMADENIDFIIPFHTGLRTEVRKIKGIGNWKNYKLQQTEKRNGKSLGHNESVNIYTDVIDAAIAAGEPMRNKKDFVNKYLQVCKERGITPKYERFLNKGKNGNYVYTDGYHKFLVDFKLFDRKTGKMLPFDAVKPEFDDQVNRRIVDDYMEGEKVEKDYTDVLEKVRDVLGLEQPEERTIVTSKKERYTTDGELADEVSRTDADYEEYAAVGDEEKAREAVRVEAERKGFTIHAFHGTNRADRVGNVFLPERATSGPMAFFSSSKEIADGYAKNKKDNSFEYDEYSDYSMTDFHTWFKVKKGEKDSRIENLWYMIPRDKQLEIAEKANKICNDWRDGDGSGIIIDERNDNGTGNLSWNIEQARGNVIKGLFSEWLDSGNLFNKESKFMEVLKLSGIADALKDATGNDVRYLDPEYTEPKTYDVYIKMDKPFDVSKEYNENFLTRLENWWKRLPAREKREYEKESAMSDMWDKNSVSVEEWIDEARGEIGRGETFAWTRIPDGVTAYLKHKGFDGIIDNGGKFGGDGHSVYIPFSSEQIKSAEPFTYDNDGKLVPLSKRFDESNIDIRFQKGTGVPERLEADVAAMNGLVEAGRKIGLNIRTDFENVKKEAEKNPSLAEKLKSTSGVVYGFKLNGNIYIDPSVATSETPIHEYTHLWAEGLRRSNSEAWNRLKELMREEKETLDYVKKLYPELKDDDSLMEEVFAHYSGKRGAERLREDMQREMDKADGVFEKAMVGRVFSKIKDLLDRFWKMSRDLFAGNNAALKSMSAEDFADMAMNDLLRGFNPDGPDGGKKADTFYSNAERSVEGIKQERATAEQWLAMIQKNGGLKSGEDKWLGLSDWLKERSGKKLDKQEVLDFIRQNKIQVEEVKYADGSIKSKEINEIEKVYPGASTAFYFEDNAQEPRWTVLNDNDAKEFYEKYSGEKVDWKLNGQLTWDERDMIADWFDKLIEGGDKPIDNVRASYTTKGLTNKREIALTVPTIEPYNTNDPVHFGDAGNGRAVAWVRFGDAKDEEGKRVLVIDEIQSKRHQDGREQGYKDKELERLDKAWENAEKEYDSIKEKMVSKYGTDDASTYSEEDERAVNRALYKIKIAGKAAEDYAAKIGQSAEYGIPDAPFDKNWMELTFKRVLRYAAENGYDKVAWTTGRQQAERYDLRKAIDYINCGANDDRGLTASVGVGGFGRGNIMTDADGIVIYADGALKESVNKPLSDTFGKEIATQMMRMKSGERIQGEDLSIGGEGMAAFYDRMIPQFADKYCKKWGTKTADVELDLPNEADRVMHSVDVTPEMKKSVMEEGQPMFMKGEEDKKKAKAATLFSGAGTLEQGLTDIIDPIFAAEWDEKIRSVYKDNNGDHWIFPDVNNISEEDIVNVTKDGNSIQYLHASPVCKAFSGAHNGKEVTEEEIMRDMQFADSVRRIIVMTQPSVFTLENVPAYINSEPYKAIKDMLETMGYAVDEHVYNSADYGAATERTRLIVRAVKGGMTVPPRPAHVEHTSWMERISDLIDTKNAEVISREEAEKYLNDYNGRRNPGDSYIVLGKLFGKWRVRDERKAAPTILAGKTNREFVLTPTEDGDYYVTRLTPRMLARIQGLSDDFELPDNNETLAHTVIGNGIPVELTKAVIAPLIESRILDIRERKMASKKMEQQYEQLADEYLTDFTRGGETENKLRKLFDKYVANMADENIVPFLSPNMKYTGAQSKIAHALKGEKYATVGGKRVLVDASDGEKAAAIEAAASQMAPMVPKDAVLVPIPSRTGKATSTKDLAEAISKLTGAPVADILEGLNRRSIYDMKSKGLKVNPEMLGFKQVGDVPEGKRIIFIDNVIDEGNTAAAAVRACKGGTVLAYTYAGEKKGNRIPLRSAELVTYDDMGNVIPLNERFDPNNKENDIRYRTSEELDKTNPGWREQQNASGGHSTQVKKTLSSYTNIGEHLKGEGKEGVTILDASSGLGHGTQALRDMGFDVEDVEPYPSSNREQAPTYTDYKDVNKQYDVVISNAVLNVIPDDWRADVLKSMADKVKVGGRMIINVRGDKEIASQGVEGKTKETLDNPSEILVKNPDGSYRAYQKGFSKQELKQYVEEQLGEGWSVEIGNEKNSGLKSGTVVVATRNNADKLVYKDVPEEVMQSAAKREESLSEIIYDKWMEKLRGMSPRDKDYRYIDEKEMSAKQNSVASIFEDNGWDVTKSRSNKNGLSLYVNVKSPNGQELKIRISDHSVTSNERLLNELHVKPYMSDEDIYRYATNEEPKERGAGSAANGTEIEAMRNVVNAATERFGAKINVIEKSADVPEGVKPTAKGWYSLRTGEVTVVLENNRDARDIARTIAHETIAHKGLRELLGSEENYNRFLDEVYTHLRGDMKKRIDEEVGRKFIGGAENGIDSFRRERVDELFAELAEKPFEDFTKEDRTLWEKLKDIVRKALDKLLGGGMLDKNFVIGDNEMRYMLWRAKEHMERGKEDPLQYAQDVTKRRELGLDGGAYGTDRDIVYSAEQTKSKRFKNWFGDWENDPANASKVVDKNGRPMVVYHGTTESFSVFDASKVGRTGYADTKVGEAYFFTNDKVTAGMVATTNADGTFSDKDAKFMQVYLNMRNPSVYDPSQWGDPDVINPDTMARLIELAKKNGKDGVIYRSKTMGDTYVVFSNKQIKSATDNNGGFDPNNPDIRYREGEDDEQLTDIMRDHSMGMHERTTAMRVFESEKNAEDVERRKNAIIAINGNLRDINKALRAQKEFDRSTVKRVTDMARVMLSAGHLSDMSASEVKRLLTIVKNGTGKIDQSADIDRLVDLMINNRLKRSLESFNGMLKIKGGKVDARGIQVMGKLDPTGQRILGTFKKAMKLDDKTIESKIAEAENKMGSDNKVESDNASLDYMSLNLAKEYNERIKSTMQDESDLKSELRRAKEEGDSKDYIRSIEEAIRDTRIARLDAYEEMTQLLGGKMRESVEKALEIKDAEVNRVRDIQHNANSDLEGKAAVEHYHESGLDKVNNTLAGSIMAPLATFEQFLRFFGSKSANGEGYLYNRFMRGWVDSRDKEITGLRSKWAIMDAKAAEVFGGKVKTWNDMTKLVGSMPNENVRFWDGDAIKDHSLGQGELMYIYMVDKMSDGRMKLRKMGIDEKEVDRITQLLDPRLREMADWMQDEFLVDTRNEYNETHKRVFGAPMAEVENYFPLKINQPSRHKTAEELDNDNFVEGISTKTGSIITRRKNTTALDLTNANALNVLLDHVQKMEHWNAFVEFNRDLNTLRTYNKFSNRLRAMKTIYGSGDELIDKFNKTCKMASGAYIPATKEAKFDNAVMNVAKGVTAAKVSLRMFTAFKQFLSMPAFAPDVRADYWAKSIASPKASWDWAMENLPVFQERWKSRMGGDPRLMATDADWAIWRNDVARMASKFGMSPNALVDAVTISIGSKAVYDTKLNHYIKQGFKKDEADKRAKQDATIAFNLTQQSSEGAFLSPIQVDRTLASVTFTVFRNSAMSYTRQEVKALRDIAKTIKPGYRKDTMEFMEKQYMRNWGAGMMDEGMTQEQAEVNAKAFAKKEVNKQYLRNAVRLGTFGWVVEMAWNLGAYLPYILLGSDEDEKKKLWKDAWRHSWFGSVEGLAGGDMMSELGRMLVMSDFDAEGLEKKLPVESDIAKALKYFQNGNTAEFINDMINLVIQSGIGINPQSITDGVLAIMDACGDDPELAHEAAIAVCRILQVPQSQIEKMYFDDVNLPGDEVSNYTPEQLARRYAEYKVKRGRFMTFGIGGTWNDEEATEKKEKNIKKIIKERTVPTELDKAYAEMDDSVKQIKKDRKSGINVGEAEIGKARVFDNLDKGLSKISKRYIEAGDPEKAKKIRVAMTDYKQAMMDYMSAADDNERIDAERRMNESMEKAFED